MIIKEDFINNMKPILGDEMDNFIASLSEPSIRSFRINHKYIAEDYFESINDLSITKIQPLKGSYIVNEDIKFGFHPLHHAGAIYLQDPSAMLPTKLKDLSNVKLALDLCASPGGKTLDLALNIDGILISNEIDYKRSKVLYSNVERFGLNNIIITNNTSEELSRKFDSVFDLVLVDSPCSGEGMFRKYPEAMNEWSNENVKQCAIRDIEIVKHASKMLKKGGYLIYSTCTFEKCENEDIVSYLVDNLDFKVIKPDVNLSSFAREGLIPNTFRIYPHDNFGEGQFMCLLQKEVGEEKTINMSKLKNSKNIQLFNSFVKDYLSLNVDNVIEHDNVFYYLAGNLDISNLRLISSGAKLGEIVNNRFIPDHYFFKAFSGLFKSSVNLDFKDERVAKYLRGEEIKCEALKGYGVLFVNGVPLGGYKASNGVLKNLYPKGLRNY